MPDYNYPPSDNEPTLPGGQSSYYSQWRNNQPQDSARQPYQFPPPQGSDGLEATRPAFPLNQDNGAVYQPTTPLSYPGPAAGKEGVKLPPTRRKRGRRGCAIGCLSTILICVILGILLFVTGQKALAFGSVISNQTPLSTQTGYMGGSQRVNFLIMGYGGSGHDGSYLTDSMVIISLLPQSHHTTLVSVPRDLWVQNPANSGSYSKLNAVYPVAAGNTNTNPLTGGNAVATKMSLITGLQINYWMTINFTGFKDFIDAIGGVDVNVPDSFNACYPKNDDPAVNASWIKIQFTKGLQHMNGATAIEYARAREPIEVCSTATSINQAELSDFGRSQRQQLIMQAALVKLKQWQTWPSFFNAMDTLQKTLYSDFSLADLAEFALKMDLKDAHRVGLSLSNVLENATSSDGQAILQPRNGDWAQIPAYIQKQLYN
ncbi:MAG TPA: LCP family protein [Ktedonobacteraceae bacterium]